MAILLAVLAIALITGSVAVAATRRRRAARLQRIRRKLDILLEHQGLVAELWPRPSDAALRLMGNRSMIEAIRVYREENPGLGLMEARLGLLEVTGAEAPGDDLYLERRVDTLIRAAGLEEQVLLEAAEEVRRLVRDGRKVEAIQALRQANPRVGLAEAREVVDNLR